MDETSISCEELEALHDVIEAARCFWNKHSLARSRAAAVLQTMNKLYWRLGEELPVTGSPSERFGLVSHSSTGSDVERLIDIVLELSRRYAIESDPWWADTVLISPDIANDLSSDKFVEFENSLERLGMVVLLSDDVGAKNLILERRDIGPWPSLAAMD